MTRHTHITPGNTEGMPSGGWLQQAVAGGGRKACRDLLWPAVAPQEVSEQGPVVRRQQLLSLPAVLADRAHRGSALHADCTHKPPQNALCTAHNVIRIVRSCSRPCGSATRAAHLI